MVPSVFQSGVLYDSLPQHQVLPAPASLCQVWFGKYSAVNISEKVSLVSTACDISEPLKIYFLFCFFCYFFYWLGKLYHMLQSQVRSRTLNVEQTTVFLAYPFPDESRWCSHRSSFLGCSRGTTFHSGAWSCSAGGAPGPCQVPKPLQKHTRTTDWLLLIFPLSAEIKITICNEER